MIYTLTLNPSIDYVLSLHELIPGCVNRSLSQSLFPGGKGINVSIVLSSLGTPSVALGFVSGFTGSQILKSLSLSGNLVKPDFVVSESAGQFSRINVKLETNACETEINAPGPVITESDEKKLFEKLDLLRDGDMLVLAGSIPLSLKSDFYSRIMKSLSARKISFVVDATKSLLTDCLQFRPFLVKPNNHELGEIFGVALETAQDCIPYAKKLRHMGAENVLVSLGGNGALLVSEENVFECPCPRISVVNTVGSGDSMVAAFIHSLCEKKSMEDALKFAVAAGSASASKNWLCNKNDVLQMLEKF